MNARVHRSEFVRGVAALGYVRDYQWQWADAEKAFLKAIELNPSNALARLWYANLLMSRRRFDESLRRLSCAGPWRSIHSICKRGGASPARPQRYGRAWLYQELRR